MKALTVKLLAVIGLLSLCATPVMIVRYYSGPRSAQSLQPARATAPAPLLESPAYVYREGSNTLRFATREQLTNYARERELLHALERAREKLKAPLPASPLIHPTFPPTIVER